jgi:hypothetical protein
MTIDLTDEELLLHQLKNPPTMSMALNKDHLYRMMADHMKEAADRIDELEVSLQAVLNREAATTARYDAKTDELEAKLAKAVELAKEAIETMVSGPFYPDEEERRLLSKLAEIESSTPYGLKGEKG